jgi:predicted anti-sigma-YlaC factor YlaD
MGEERKEPGMFGWTERGCRQYQIRMEEYLGSVPEAIESDAKLAGHLRQCEACRESLAAAQLSEQLFSAAEEPMVQPTEAFVTRVMASIREEEARQSVQVTVWRSLEALASRFALVAAVVLLALSVFLGEFAPALRQPEVVGTATPAATGITGDWPEPPAQPSTQDEVLMSLVGSDNGI